MKRLKILKNLLEIKKSNQNTLNKLDYDNEERKVFCISFHFARFKNEKFPYKGDNIYE